MYCRKILIPKFRDERENLVIGIHEPIISVELFAKVQNVLNDNNRNVKITIMSNNDFPLKGLMSCPRCNRAICGSSSKGRGAT